MNMHVSSFVIAQPHDGHVRLYRTVEHVSTMHDVRAAILRAERERWGFWYVTWKQAAHAALRKARSLRLSMEVA